MYQNQYLEGQIGCLYISCIVSVRDLRMFLGVDVAAEAKVLAVGRLLSALFREIQHVLRGRHLQE